MPLKHIAHFVDIYPQVQYKYIYDQVTDGRERKSSIIAERFFGNPLHDNLCFFRRIRSNPWLMRLDNLLTERIPAGNNLYLAALNRFYKRKLKSMDASLMHAHSGMSGYKLSRQRKESGIPLVVTFYGNDVSYCLKERRWLKRYTELFKSGDIFIVLCNEARERLIRHGCSADKIKLWNIGLDLDNYSYRQRNNTGPVKFLIVARFVEAKGYTVLLKAFAGLLKARSDVELTMAGYGILKNQFVNLAHKLGIQDKISVIDTTGRADFYSFLKELLYSHDIFVLPSTVSSSGEDEGGPALTMVYAQSSGLPVISTPFPGAEITVMDGKTGLFCEQDNHKSLRDKMEHLVDNKSLRLEMGLSGSALAGQEFSLLPQLNKLNDIYSELSS